MDVVADIRAALSDPRRLAELVGLLEGSKREGRGIFVRCPVHAERTPSCSITPGPDGTVRVNCFGCGFTGDVFHLVAASRGLSIDRQFRQVLAAAAELAGIDLGGGPSRPPVPRVPAPAPPIVRPPRAELEALWRASSPVDLTQVDPHPSDLEVGRFCARRRWWPREVSALKVVRALPLEHAWPAWWPGSWSPSWRLAVLAYEVDGTPASIHARSIDGATPKTRWPRGCSAAGLFFATVGARKLLLGTPPPLEGVLLVEGLSDFVAGALAMAGRPWAVLGATSGSFPALSRVPWPAGVRAVVATDRDPAGERYFAEIKAALPRVDVRRFRASESSAA